MHIVRGIPQGGNLGRTALIMKYDCTFLLVQLSECKNELYLNAVQHKKYITIRQLEHSNVESLTIDPLIIK